MPRFYGEKDYDRAARDLFEPQPDPAAKTAKKPPRIAADLFCRLVEERKAGPSRPCTVAGMADFSNRRFGQGLGFHGIRFESDFFADVATFASLTFADCEFVGDLILPNCRIEGFLHFSGCHFVLEDGAEAPDQRFRVFLSGSRIEGDLWVDLVSLKGACSFSGITIGGNLKIGGMRIEAPPETGMLVLDNTRVSGEIALAPFNASAQPPPGASGGGVHRSIVPGFVSAYGASCHSFTVSAADVEGPCSLTGLRVTTSLDIRDCSFADGLNFDHLVCGEVLGIYGCTVVGRLGFDGATIPAQLRITAGEFGDISFNGSKVGSLWVGTEGKVGCTRIHATSSSFSSYVKMVRLTVRVAPADDAPAGAETAAPGGSGMIDFEHCRFGSLITTWPVLDVAGIDGWGEDDFVAVERGLSFTDCDVDGSLTFTRLQVGGKGASDAGFVRLDRTHLRGPLFISSALAIARRRQVPEPTRRRARALIEAGKDGEYRARMRSLSMREFSASAAELSGLDLVICRRDDDESGDDGCLLGHRLRIAGLFETYVPGTFPALRERRPRARASIGGALRLRAARIGELHLDGDSFRQRRGCSAWGSGVVLELAEIGVLRVPRTETSSDPDLNGFPVPLDLSGMTVRNWSFHEDVDVEDRASADDFLDFLDNDEGLHREVYKSVARSLRDAGRDDDAERVLYAEEYRARWESRRPGAAERREWPVLNPPLFSILGVGPKARLKGRRGRPWLRFGRWFEPFDRFFLQYRRNTIRLFYVIVALFLASWMLVSGHATNFELSEPARLVLQGEGGRPTGLAYGIEYRIDGRNVGPDPDHWRAANALWMTTRYHVPIVSMLVEDEYVASNDNRLRIGLPWERPRLRRPGDGPGHVRFSAEDWFGLMSLLNWIMWPLLLTFALRRALRSD